MAPPKVPPLKPNDALARHIDLAQRWCLQTTKRFNGCPAENEDDAARFFEEQLKHTPFEDLFAEIHNNDRNRNESLAQFRIRLEKKPAGQAGYTNAGFVQRLAGESDAEYTERRNKERLERPWSAYG